MVLSVFTLVRMLLYDRVDKCHQLFNISIWDINRDKLFIISANAGNIFLFILAVCLLAIVLLCFGFYIWFFVTSSENSQVRLLNILHVYLSVGCIEGSITTFIIMLASGLGYHDTSTERILAGFHIVAISVTFLFISIATLLKQFKPDVYLDLSVAWRHSVALLTMLVFCISVDVSIFYYCHISLEKECMKITVRKFLLIPATSINFILQVIVLIDDVWGFRNIIKNETPVTNFQDPALGLQHHVVCS